jgi:phosphatidate phosphatase PAH1
MSRIFIINPKGEIHQLNNSYTKTYSLLNAQVDEVFPKIEPSKEVSEVLIVRY